MLALPFHLLALRLVVALLLGAVIGAERARRLHTSQPHSAGMRTLALVALGSTLATIISAYGFLQFGGRPGVQVQPAQIAAQVITGIGFLGAGVILLRKDTVRGLTTAATIWLMASIGLACGLGFLWEATLATTLTLVMLTVLRPIERRLFPSTSPHLFHIALDHGGSGVELFDQIRSVLKSNDIALDGVSIQDGPRGDIIKLRCRAKENADLLGTALALRHLPHVRAVRVDARKRMHDSSQTPI